MNHGGRLGNLEILISEKVIDYSGKELSPHFVLRTFGLSGNAVVAFEGGCRVATEHLIDWDDRLEGEVIQSKRMVHFLGEFFGLTLVETVLFQILFVAATQEILNSKWAKEGKTIRAVRKGNDLFILDRKLSVSIVTASPVSTLLHFGVNLDPEGAPVAAIGLNELGINSREFAQKVMELVKSDWANVSHACTKVRPVL